LPAKVEAKLAAAADTGIVAVRSTRGYAGNVTIAEASYEKAHILHSQGLNPQKARILLQLALLQTKDPAAIQAWFDNY